MRFSPQQKSAPVAVIAQVCRDPALTAAKRALDCTAVGIASQGEGRVVPQRPRAIPTPSWPLPFAPQHRSCPVKRMPQVWLPPTVIALQPVAVTGMLTTRSAYTYAVGAVGRSHATLTATRMAQCRAAHVRVRNTEKGTMTGIVNARNGMSQARRGAPTALALMACGTSASAAMTEDPRRTARDLRAAIIFGIVAATIELGVLLYFFR